MPAEPKGRKAERTADPIPAGGASGVPAVRAEAPLPAVPQRPPDTQAQVQLPRIVLLQDTSGEVKRSEDKLEAGLFYNRLTKLTLGKEVQFIPLHHYPTRVRLVVGAGLQCRSRDTISADMMGGRTFDNKPTADCGMCKLWMWPRDRVAQGESLPEQMLSQGPECAIVHNFPSLIVDGDDPDAYEFAVFQLSKTSNKAAQDLISLVLASRRAAYHRVYRNTARTAVGKQDRVYFKQEIGLVRPATPAEIKAATDTLDFMAKNKVDIGAEVNEEELTTDGGAGTSEERRAAAQAETSF